MRSSAVTEHYAKLLTDIYQEIKNQGNQPGNGWSVQYQPEYGITTWTLDEPKAKGRTGSNDKLVVKLLAAGSYDFVKTEDYLARGRSLFDASNRLLDKYCNGNPILKKQLSNWMKQTLDSFDKDVKAQCVLIPERMRANDVKHFIDVHENARKLLKQLLANLAGGLEAVQPEMKLANIVADIEQSEKDFIHEQGRPNIVKVGSIGEDMDVDLVSAQFTRGDETVPSTKRYANGNTKLSNHVLDVSGVVAADNQVNVTLTVDGHSSYTPISVKDAWQRIQLGTQALEEKIARSVADMLKADPTLTGQTIKYSLSSMMLLTPVSMKFAEDFIRKGESESLQVHDGRIVMDLVKYRKQPMAVTVDGSTVHVQFDHTYMNVPANAVMKVHNKGLSSSLQEKMNAKGFYEYIQLMQNDMGEIIKKLYAQNNVELAGLLKMANPALNKLESLQKLQASLQEDYNKLDQLLQNNGNPDEIKKALKAINVCNDVIDKKYGEALKEYYDAFNANKDALKHVINAGLIHSGFKNMSPEIVAYFKIQQRFIQAQEMYFNKEYLNPKKAYIFQALYLLNHAQKGRDIEAFCKSGEDRTGWIRVTLLALLAYNAKYGRDPDFNNETEVKRYSQFYSSAAHELSASLENTAYNSASRGMQVASDYTTQDKLMQCDTAMGTLAKTLFKEKLPAPTRTCQLENGKLIFGVVDQVNKLDRRLSLSGSIMVNAKRFSKSARDSLKLTSSEKLKSSTETTPDGSPAITKRW